MLPTTPQNPWSLVRDGVERLPVSFQLCLVSVVFSASRDESVYVSDFKGEMFG